MVEADVCMLQLQCILQSLQLMCPWSLHCCPVPQPWWLHSSCPIVFFCVHFSHTSTYPDSNRYSRLKTLVVPGMSKCLECWVTLLLHAWNYLLPSSPVTSDPPLSYRLNDFLDTSYRNSALCLSNHKHSVFTWHYSLIQWYLNASLPERSECSSF